MKYGLGVNVNETVRDTVEKSVLAERLGYDYVWVSDVPEQIYAPVVASAIAARTKRIKIGLGLLSPFLHSPLQIASSVITLNETYGDRFELCMGPGDRNQLKRIGIDLSKLGGGISERLLAAKSDIGNILKKQGARCPILLGAQGPKMLGIARFFDGVLLNYGSPDLVKWAVDQIGPIEAQDFELGVYALSYVYAEHDPRVHDLLKASSVFVAMGASRSVLEKLNIYKEVARMRRESEAGASLESFSDSVYARLVGFFSIHRHLSELDAYVARLAKIGIQQVVFGYPQNFSRVTVRQLSRALRAKS